MASGTDNNVSVGQSNRNLWIILGSILGLLIVAFIIGVAWICRRRLQRRGLLPTRTVTPLDDAEFESWRRPSQQYHQQPERYTVMPRERTSVQRAFDSYTMDQREDALLEKAQSPSQRPSTPPRTHRSHGRRHSSRTSSIHDRPPTPYSARMRIDELDGPPSPTSITRPKRTHVHYPSTSEASEFDFEFEKFEIDTTPQFNNHDDNHFRKL